MTSLFTPVAIALRRSSEWDEGIDEIHATRVTEGKESERREKGNCMDAMDEEKRGSAESGRSSRQRSLWRFPEGACTVD